MKRAWIHPTALLFFFLCSTATTAQPAPEAAAPADEATAAADATTEEAPAASFFAATTVTALGHDADTFQVATPVSVVDAAELERRAPDNAALLLRDLPGTDVNGVGPNQARPVIRGQRGLRVLFLGDGLRLNNPRRQTDFGEISGLVDLADVETVEVVRGPASVLYGSDAIGGVLNLITKVPGYREGARFGGSLEARFVTAGDQQRIHASVEGERGPFSFLLAGSYRDVEEYDAPSGTFGNLHLAEDTPVVDSGVRDDNYFGVLGYRLSDDHTFQLKLNRYRADQSGFGLVEPEAIGDTSGARIRIFYPFQDFDRAALYYLGSLNAALVDTLDVKVYQQSNERALNNDIQVDIGPIGPGFPNSSLAALTANFTDLDTTGIRTEAIKGFGRHLLTYGFEVSRDESTNTDSSITTTFLRFPRGVVVPIVSESDRANAPNAVNNSWGAFAQDEIALGERVRVTAGARYQKVSTEARATPDWDITGLDFDDDQLVGALTATYQATDEINLLASYGTAFRAPNIIERLFNGITPEGIGFQILNADLTSERSRNWDLGLKYRRSNAFGELVVFRNEIRDGIVQHFLTAAEIAALPAAAQDAIRQSGARSVVQQRNVDRLTFDGVELAVGWRWDKGLVVGANYTHLDGEREGATVVPVADLYADKINAYVRWSPSSDRYWVEYRVRANGEVDVALEPGEPEPLVGTVLPRFTIHTLSGGVTLFERNRQRHELVLIADNLTDELYAEFSNATFFRPEPGRTISATYRLRF
jgi:outer membrane receptor protein involved in Fe transport